MLNFIRFLQLNHFFPAVHFTRVYSEAILFKLLLEPSVIAMFDSYSMGKTHQGSVAAAEVRTS